jgi:hypothetical protein
MKLDTSLQRTQIRALRGSGPYGCHSIGGTFAVTQADKFWEITNCRPDMR